MYQLSIFRFPSDFNSYPDKRVNSVSPRKHEVSVNSGKSTVSSIISEEKDAVCEGRRSRRYRGWLFWWFSTGHTAGDSFSTLLSRLCTQGGWHPVGHDQWTALVVYPRMGRKWLSVFHLLWLRTARVSHWEPCSCLPWVAVSSMKGTLRFTIQAGAVSHCRSCSTDYPLACPNLWK